MLTPYVEYLLEAYLSVLIDKLIMLLVLAIDFWQALIIGSVILWLLLLILHQPTIFKFSIPYRQKILFSLKMILKILIAIAFIWLFYQDRSPTLVK